MTIYQRAREAALILHDWHVARFEQAPTAWVVRRDAAPYALYLRKGDKEAK